MMPKEGSARGLRYQLVMILRRYTILAILLGMLVICSLISDKFLSLSNFRNVLTQAAPLGIVCVGATFLMISGYRDLSVGMVMGLSAALTMGLQPVLGIFSIFAGLAAGAIVGLINGFFVSYLGMHTFVVTMAMMQGVRSLTYIYTQEKPIVGTIPAFANFGSGTFLGISYLLWMFLIAIGVMEFILRATRHGKNTYAVGGNKEAAFNAGINVHKTVITNFVICSVAGALGGIFYAARGNSTTATLGWPDSHFLVIVMVVLGGTKLSGGYGNELFTFGGVFVYYTLQNVMNMLNINAYYATLSTGVLLIVVLLLDKMINPIRAYRRIEEKADKKPPKGGRSLTGEQGC